MGTWKEERSNLNELNNLKYYHTRLEEREIHANNASKVSMERYLESVGYCVPKEMEDRVLSYLYRRTYNEDGSLRENFLNAVKLTEKIRKNTPSINLKIGSAISLWEKSINGEELSEKEVDRFITLMYGNRLTESSISELREGVYSLLEREEGKEDVDKALELGVEAENRANKAEEDLAKSTRSEAAKRGAQTKKHNQEINDLNNKHSQELEKAKNDADAQKKVALDNQRNRYNKKLADAEKQQALLAKDIEKQQAIADERQKTIDLLVATLQKAQQSNNPQEVQQTQAKLEQAQQQKAQADSKLNSSVQAKQAVDTSIKYYANNQEPPKSVLGKIGGWMKKHPKLTAGLGLGAAALAAYGLNIGGARTFTNNLVKKGVNAIKNSAYRGSQANATKGIGGSYANKVNDSFGVGSVGTGADPDTLVHGSLGDDATSRYAGLRAEAKMDNADAWNLERRGTSDTDYYNKVNGNQGSVVNANKDFRQADNANLSSQNPQESVYSRTSDYIKPNQKATVVPPSKGTKYSTYSELNNARNNFIADRQKELVGQGMDNFKARDIAEQEWSKRK